MTASADSRKPYEAPSIIWTEPMQLRAVLCAKASDNECGLGAILS